MLTLRQVKLNRINKTYNATFCSTRKCAWLLDEGEGQDRDRSYPGCTVWDAEACLDNLEPGAWAKMWELPCPILRASMKESHGNNFLCHQGT